MLQAYAYLIHLLAGFAMLAAFAFVYLHVTPFDEIALIRRGNVAAALSFAGALIGFCLTLASSIMHSDGFVVFVSWAAGAMLVQVLTYALTTRIVHNMNEAITEDNVAMGTLMFSVSVVVGIVNAACLS